MRKTLVPLIFLALAGASAQEPTTFSVTRQLVVETVNVRDKNGKAIEGLTAKDFTVTEDGVPQEIKFFDYQKLDEGATPLAPTVVWEPIRTKLSHTQISSEPPGSGKYRDRRLLVLYFDMTAMPVPDQLRAIDSAQKFVTTQITAADLVAIMMFDSGSVQVLEDFTDDRARLMNTLHILAVGEGEGNDETTADASSADTGAAFGQDDSEFNIFNTDRQLSALQTAAKMLSRVTEKKSLIYFASGLRLNGLDNQAQLHATVNEAVRAGVTMFTIDARGLVASAPMGDATQGSPGGSGMYTGASAMAMQQNYQLSQDTLWSIASDTGGKALLDYNDLTKGIVQAQKSITSYYIIGYYTSNDKQDGKYRRIKITLNNGTAANLDFRQGYFAGKIFAKFTAADKERQLEDALLLPDPITELTIAMEIDYFQLNRAEYFVPIAVKIPGRELALARRRGAEHTLIDFIGEIKDEFGTTVSNVRDKVDVRLSGQTAAELAKRPIQYEAGFTLLPGKYVIKFLARDAETGRIGTYQTTFVIPNLNKEEKRIPISSVVLSGQKMDLKEALYTVKKEDQTINPLVENGQKIIPSVTRVFSKSRDMHIYLEAYERYAATMQPLAAFASFYRDGVKVFETRPVEVTDGENAKSKAVPLRFSASLASLAPGEYTCQVTVLDPAGQKAAFWSAPVRVVP
ncbi:MAG TPA: VWA domain-containing protein [Bryobacteraceae bacterium]|nr:VWA domain-containing protein [Bryobacteraceae bacterium]